MRAITFNRFVGRSVRLTNIIICILTFGAYFAADIRPSQAWIFTLLAIGYPWLLLLNLGYIIFWALAKRRYILFSLLTLGMGVPQLSTYIGTSLFNTPDADDIKVISYNIHSFQFNPNRGFLPNDLAIDSFIISEKPDILFLQETPPCNAQLRFAYLQKVLDLPYVYKEDNRLITIISKYPIINKGRLALDGRVNGVFFADVKINTETVRLYAVHLSSNQVTAIAKDVTNNMDSDEAWKKVKNMGGRVTRAAVIREWQADYLKEHLQQCPYPIILGGDFNDVPLSYAYKQVADAPLNNGFVKKGCGIGSTFLKNMPLLHIDHIFASDDFVFTDYEIKAIRLSDHKPVIARLRRK